jgi:hypothetical protein
MPGTGQGAGEIIIYYGGPVLSFAQLTIFVKQVRKTNHQIQL